MNVSNLDVVNLDAQYIDTENETVNCWLGVGIDPVNKECGDTTTGRLILGEQGNPGFTHSVLLSKSTLTNTLDTLQAGTYFETQFAPDTTPSSISYFGMQTVAWVPESCSADFSGFIRGHDVRMRFSGSGSAGAIGGIVIGVITDTGMPASSTIAVANALQATLIHGGNGTLTEVNMLRVSNPTNNGTGTIATIYGLNIQTINTASTKAVSIRFQAPLAGTTRYGIHSDSNVASCAAGFVAGTAGDVCIYRAAAGAWTFGTDQDLRVPGYLNAGSSSAPTNTNNGDISGLRIFDSDIRVVRSCTAGSGISCSVTDGILNVTATGGGTVTSVTGTANQITSTGGTTPVLSIPSDFRPPGSLAVGVAPIGTTAGDVNGLRWLSPSATDFSAYAGRTTAPNFVVTSQGATSNYAKVGSGNGNIISYGGDGSSADLHVVLGSKGSYPTSLFPGGVEALRAHYVALAANYVSVYPAVTSPIRIVAEGTGPNVGINLEGKGSGNIDHYAGGGLVLRVSGFVSVPVNNVIILASNSGQPLLVGSQGTDTDISIYLQSKAAGAAGLRAGSTNLFDCTTARCTTLASTPLQDNGVRVVRSCTAGSGISCSVTDGVLSVTNTAPGTVSGSAPSFVAFGSGACIASGTPAFSVYRGAWPSFVIRVDAGLSGCTAMEPIVTFSVGTTCTAGRPYCSIAKYSIGSGGPATVTPNVEWPAVNPDSRIMLRADPASTGLQPNSINYWMFVCQCGV